MYCSSKRHDVNKNMTETFFEVKIFFEKKQTKAKFDLFKKLWNFLAILELCAFYIEYKNAKFTELTFLIEPVLNNFLQTAFAIL